MRRLAPLLLIIAAVQMFPSFASAEEPVRERIEWIDIWVTNADKENLPRVLFVGDSIARGYFSVAEKQIGGKANCARLTTSKCVSDPSFADELKLLLGQYDFDVIHINNGLHGWGYTEEQYREGLLKCLETIQEHAPDSQLIWAMTTPMRDTSDLQKFGERNPRVIARNEIAATIMKAREIPTNDLYGLVEQRPELTSKDGVHFNEAGRQAQGAAVAESALKHLQRQ